MCWVCLGCGAPELIFLVLEQNVEGGQRTVRAGDILLHLHLFGVAKLRMGINFLFEHTQIITDHDDFVEEDVERHFFCLQRRIGWMKHNPAFVPTRSELFDIRITSRKTEIIDGVSDDFFDKHRKRLLESRNCGLSFGRFQTGGFGRDGAFAGFKSNIGGVLRNGFDRADSILWMANLHP